jgi:16S rRNA (uracil1498-N3)-methyltransferase
VSFYLVDDLPGSGAFTLTGAEGHHAATVRRLRPGEHVVLTDGRGGRAAAVVTAAGRGTLDLRVEPACLVPAADPSITVVQAIAKGDRGELAVQAMTEVGVDAIVPWSAARSVAQWRDGRPLERWRATAREAAKQAGRAWVPPIAPLASTSDVCERLRSASCAFVLDAGAPAPLSTVDLPATGEVVLVVGPEGGVADDELAAFVAAGGVPVRLGASVLRTSTAGVAAIAALSARLGRW